MKTISYRKGVTLVEALMVIGVLAVLLGLAMLVYLLVHASILANITQQEAMTILSATQGMKADDGNGSKILATADLIPHSYIFGENLVTPYGTKLDVWFDKVNDNDVLELQFWSLPRNACVRLPLLMTNNAEEINVNGFILTGSDKVATLSPKDLSSNCYDGGGNFFSVKYPRS